MPPNALIKEKSPYLLQHAHNPVDWHPWTDDTFEKARRKNMPIFLSIGYATCHWCHVMEKETFEDSEAAGYLNDTFICIKVDREERPDIDAVYMAACQLMTGSGGWPLSIFMTPDKKPFFAATYLPKRNRFGRAGVIELCQQLKKMWQGANSKVLSSAEGIATHLEKSFEYKSAEEPGVELLDEGYRLLVESFDPQNGGFDTAPKFPSPHRLLFLLRTYHRTGASEALEMVEKTLTAMRLGGIWDHVGYGFHRYSTDTQWLLPHFEKMLYDQALVALAYLETYQVTKNRFFADTAHDILRYVLRDMQSEKGGFYSAEDADSEGEEGKFYVWTNTQFRQVLGADKAERWCNIFNMAEGGNFRDESSGRKTGASILHLKELPQTLCRNSGMDADSFAAEWEQVREILYREREKRIHPLKDDKVLTDWNGFMIAALARGGRILESVEYTAAAEKAADFITGNMVAEDGCLLHRYREGEGAIHGHAEDYAFLIFGLLELYQNTFDPEYLQRALSFQDRMLSDFWDNDKGGFFSSSQSNRELPVRPKELYDGAIPSANSVSLLNLLYLARLTGDSKWEERAQLLIQAFAGSVKSHPPAYTFFLVGIDFALNPGQDIVIAGEPQSQDTLGMLSALNVNFSPNGVTLFKTSGNAEQLAKVSEYTAALDLVEGKATAHICKGASCRESTTDVASMLKQILVKK